MWLKFWKKDNSVNQKSSSKNNNTSQSVNVSASGNDATIATILSILTGVSNKMNDMAVSFEKRMTILENHQKKNFAKLNKLSKAFGHYVDNNGVSKEVKEEVKKMLK